MRQPRKRWAWKPKHHPFAKHKAYWMAPSSSWFYLRQFWSERRVEERRVLKHLVEDADANVSFPYHHHHELKWTWC